MTSSPSMPGWDAINAVLKPIYQDREPLHYGTVIPSALGGPDPIHGISAYSRGDPEHWHIVTFGFTELWDKESDDPAVSGYGFELSIRIRKSPAEDKPPNWALNFLQNLGRYVFETGNCFDVGHHMSLNGPICAGSDTAIRAIAFAEDPELGEFSSSNGKAHFVQIVGITEDELALLKEWDTRAFLQEYASVDRMLLTDLDRRSMLTRPELASRMWQRADAEGSSMEFSHLDNSRVVDGPPVVWEVGALWVDSIRRALKGRILHGRGYALIGRKFEVRLNPGEEGTACRSGSDLDLTLPKQVAADMLSTLAPRRGEYRWAGLPGLVLRVLPSEIRDQKGQVTETIG